MFTPTPKVSVPHIRRRWPCWASFSTSSRYLGSKPAWWTPMPAVTKRLRSLPTGVSKRNPPTASRTAALPAGLSTSRLVRLWARAEASFWVKWTM